MKLKNEQIENNIHYVNENIEEPNNKNNYQLEGKYSTGIRIIFTIFIFGSALFLEKVSVFINLIGSVCGTLLSIAIPVVICNKCTPNITNKQFFVNCVILFFGVGFGCFGVKSSLEKI